MIMARVIILLFSLIVLLSQNVHAEKKSLDTITLTIPESVLAEAVRQSLPVRIDTGSDTVEGSISIHDIKNLQLEDQQISAIITLIGNDIKIKTTIAGQQLRLKLGTVKLDFNISADTRYDEPSQTLFIKPTVTDLKTQDGQTGDELGNLLIGLFNGREFPLEIDKLQPIITDTGSKKLAIEMHINNVTISKNLVTMHLLPRIKTIKQKKGSSG
jgi:hypothetical protein